MKKGRIKELKEIEGFIDEGRLATDIGMKPARLHRLLHNDVGGLTLAEIYNIADVLGVERKKVLDIVANQFLNEKRNENKNVVRPSNENQGM